MQDNVLKNSEASGKKLVAGINGMKEVQTLKEDISNLKEDAVTLARDVKASGKSVAREGIDQIYAGCETEFHKLEDHVKAKPGQSMLLAFAAGLVASFILGGRR
jgi:hypothetical protein